MKKAILIFILACLILPMEAQNTSTQGKEFWLSFMHNGFKDHDNGGWVTTQVLISAKRDCTGTVSNPLTGWSENFIVRANSITTIEIPEEQGYHNNSLYETITEKGIKVAATDTISVFCTNIANVSFDASFVLPVESLGDEYIIQCHDQSTAGSINSYVYLNETSAFIIVATEDNTEIEITPTVATLGGHPAGQTFSITMNAGETYHVRSVRSGNQRDLSGTRVLASDCKRIAVFNGNTITCIPTNMGNGYDHVFEQAMPLRSWGKSFVVTTSRNRNRDFIKITSSANDNQILMDGIPLVTLGANESYIFYMEEAEHCCFLQTSQPSAVYLYNSSSYDQNPLGGLGDPSMVWIAPVEQRIDDVTFSTFDHPDINIETHSVNIIVNTEDVDRVYFDGTQIAPSSFSQVNGNRNYSFTRMDITHGVHHISCEHGFNAHVYGFGQAKGYAYLVGSNATDISTNIIVNDVHLYVNDEFPYCIDEAITFYADVNYQNYNLLWNFGDGTTSTSNPAVHTFHEKRIFNVSLFIDSDASGCISADSDTLLFYINTTQPYIIENDETCTGQLYSGFGFSNVLINNDTILARLQDNPVNPECKDSLLVYITTTPQYNVPITDSRCWAGEPEVYDEHGFNFEYNDTGIYERTLNLQAVGGCDSIVTLTLTVGLEQHIEFDTIVCETFIWDGIAYDHDGNYSRTYPTLSGCDSIVTCHLSIGGTLIGDTLIQPSCDSFTWPLNGQTYTQSNLYSHTMTSDLGCDSILFLDLTLTYTPIPNKIHCTDEGAVVYGSPNADADTLAVVTNTEFFSFHYSFKVEEDPDNGHSNCEWQKCVWSISKPSWALDTIPGGPTMSPTGFYSECTVYVAEHSDDYVVLTATISNDCGSKERKIYLKSSFLDVDENGMSASNMRIVPNPNNGQMDLHFEHLTGRIIIKVYNMNGLLIDQTEFFNDLETNTLQYNLKNNSAGIYFIVATAKEGTVAKKVVLK